MVKYKYKFHPEQLIFVKVGASLRERLYWVVKYLVAAIVVSIISYLVFPIFIDTPEVRKLRRENQELLFNFDIINKRVEKKDWYFIEK